MKLFIRYITIFLLLAPTLTLAQSERVKKLEQELATFNGSDSVRFHLLDDLAWFSRLATPEKALEYSLQSNEIAQKIGFRKGEGVSYNMIGVIYYILGDYSQSLEYYQQALEIRKELGDLKGVGNTLDNMGSVYQRKGDYDLAVTYQIDALKIREEIGDKSGMASGYNNIGVLYKNQQDYDKALVQFEKALDIEEELNDSSSIAINYNNIGTIYFLKEEFEKAKDYYEASLKIRIAQKNQTGIISSYNNLGNVAKKEGNNVGALRYYSKAASISENIGDKTQSSLSHNGIGELQKESGKVKAAIASFEKSLAIAKEIGSIEIQKANYAELAVVYENMAKEEKNESIKSSYLYKALKYQQDFFTTHDSLFSREKIQQITELESKYEIEKHAKENEILRRKHEEAEMKRARSATVIQATLIGLLFMVLFLFILIRSNRLRKKANNQLQDKNEELISQKEEIASINENLTQANSEIKKKNDDITASINYAKRIQSAMFPDTKTLEETPITDSFIVLKPRDIVSGDFYWFHKTDDFVFTAAVDCTGHGVPGAIMSMIGFEQLTEIVTVNKETDPAAILKSLQEGVREILHQEETQNQDGMDVALCAIDLKTGQIHFAGAKRPLVMISKGEDGIPKLDTIKGDKIAIGGLKSQEGSFTSHQVDAEGEVAFYLFSDGYQDQFGGPNNRKFMMQKLKDLLLEVHEKPMEEQGKIIDKVFEDWKGDKAQIDDVLLMGFRLTVPETVAHVSV